MEYRKSPHNIDPAVVMRSIFRRPQTWAVLLLILFMIVFQSTPS